MGASPNRDLGPQKRRCARMFQGEPPDASNRLRTDLMNENPSAAATTGVEREPVRYDMTRLGDTDLHLFNEGTHDRLYERLGAHLATLDGAAGTYFAVWAPNA